MYLTSQIMGEFNFRIEKTIIVFGYCFLLYQHVNYQLTTVQIKFPIIVFDYLFQLSMFGQYCVSATVKSEFH